MKIQVLGTGCPNCLEWELRLVSQREIPTLEKLADWLCAVPA